MGATVYKGVLIAKRHAAKLTVSACRKECTKTGHGSTLGQEQLYPDSLDIKAVSDYNH